MIPILAFDSPDKCGKDTLIAAFHKATGYKYPAINRFTGTSISYADFWNRDLDEQPYLEIEAGLFDKVLLIYLDAPQDVLAKRFKEHNEKDIKIEDMNKLKNCYGRYLDKTLLPYIEIDTSQPIEDCIKEIVDFIEKQEDEDIISKQNRLIKGIKNFGNRVENTKELTNIELKFKPEEIDLIAARMTEAKAWELINEEAPEYAEIFCTLNNSIRLKLNYFKSQNLNSRQFVYHSDSCLSKYQLIKRGDTLNVFVNMRSCNIAKMLIADYYGICSIAKSLNESYFKCKDINVTLNITSAHLYKNDW